MFDYNKVKEATKLFLEGIGEDTNREGLLETPDRVARYWKAVLPGYGKEKVEDHVKMFTSDNGDMVVVHDIAIYSFCEHHIVPFVGKIHIGYVPNGKNIGLSKLVRIARVSAGRLQVQERLIKEIADNLAKCLNTEHVAVQMQATHFCMIMRGVRAHGAITTTTTVRGMFKEDSKTRDEFLQAIRHQQSVFSY